MIGIMYDAGLRKLQLGIESGRQETLDVYNKGIQLNQIEKVILETAKYKHLTVHGNIMMANPQESKNEYLLSVDYFEKLLKMSNFKLDIGLTYLAPFVGTPIRSNPAKYGIDILIDNFEFKASAMENIVCKSTKMTLSEVFSLRRSSYAKLHKYCRDNLMKMSKNDIIELFKTSKLSNTNLIILGVFDRLPSFEKYYKYINSRSTISIKDNEKFIDCCPLRLWDIDYSSDIGYFFTSLDGEKIILNGVDKELWELASGKNMLSEIYKIINFNAKFQTEMDYMLNLYEKLENKLALVFKKQ